LRKSLAIYCLFFFCCLLRSQEIQLSIRCNQQPITLHNHIPLKTGERIQIDKLKFYLKDINANKMYLVDLDKDTNYTLISSDSCIHVQLGTDSVINVAGVLSGPFDPLEGMYWAWNSGYINFKCEGIYIDTEAVKHPFSYHLGGYQSPNQTHRFLQFKSNSNSAIVELDLMNWLSTMFKEVGYNLMTPGSAAVKSIDGLLPYFKLSYEK
jgi:hypothetical protein